MRKITGVILVSAAAVLLSGCGGGGLFNRSRPDEFAVQRQAPLVVPPDFALSPPTPGAPRPMDSSTAQQAQSALFGSPQPRSAVETSVGNKAGLAAPSIRSTVGDPGTQTVDEGSVVRDIVGAPEGDGREATTSVGG